MSNFTLSDITQRAAELLGDFEHEQVSRERLLDALNVGLSELMRLRPDVVSLRSLSLPVTLAELDAKQPLYIDAQFYSPLISFVTGWVSATNDQSIESGRAQAFLSRFTSQLVVGV